jgi:molecular chaperone DnaK
VQVEVHFDFDHNGILTVTATEKEKGQQQMLIVDNAATSRLSSHELTKARADIESLFELGEDLENLEDETEERLTQAELLDQAYNLLESLEGDVAADKLREVLGEVEEAMHEEDEERITQLIEVLENLL